MDGEYNRCGQMEEFRCNDRGDGRAVAIAEWGKERDGQLNMAGRRRSVHLRLDIEVLQHAVCSAARGLGLTGSMGARYRATPSLQDGYV